MKEITLKRINRTVVNYLSIVGLWENKPHDQNNPIVVYFMNNVIKNSSFYKANNMLNPNMTAMELPVQDVNDMPTLDMGSGFFHVMIREMYKVYDSLDEIHKHQNQDVRQALIGFIGDEYKFNEYVDTIMNQYKEAMYELVRHYNSYNPEYNDMRIRILTDKMMVCAQEEDYLQAAEIRDKIKDIKKNGR